MRKNLFNVGRSRAGLLNDVQLHLQEEADDRIPVGEEAARAALPRPARTAPLRGRQRTLHRVRTLCDRVPANAITVIGAEKTRRPIGARRANAMRRATRSTNCVASFAVCVKRRARPMRSCSRRASRWPIIGAGPSSTPRIVCSCRPRPASGVHPTSGQTASRPISARFARAKDTVDIATGYEATNRGHILKDQRKGLAG